MSRLNNEWLVSFIHPILLSSELPTTTIMKIQQLLDHYGVSINPFSQEDAQSDHVFQNHCATSIYHPAWDKVSGDPANPSTAIVFGEKGAGKTALRLQLVNEIAKYNLQNPTERVFVISYDDLNPFLDTFRDRLRGRRRQGEKALKEWRLWDHMDALLTLSTRRLCSAIADDQSSDRDITAQQMKELPRLRKRDLLMLAAFYDQSSDQSHLQRWGKIKSRLGFFSPTAHWRLVLGIVVTVLTLILAGRGVNSLESMKETFGEWWWYLIVFAGWLPFLRRYVTLWWKAGQIARQIRILEHGRGTLRSILSSFPARELDGQPMPSRDRSDDRYELLAKLQRLLTPLGFSSIVVLVDRVDEPHLINGSAERMKDFLWSMFDNKFLKHPGIAFKMLLPRDVVYFLSREEKEFYERSRLDKQNLIKSLEWTGESLIDMATNRIRACLTEDANSNLSINDLFEDEITEPQLIQYFSQLRVPRHLFRFMYKLLTTHCNQATETNPSWKISRETLEREMTEYQRELDAMDRGLGTG